MEESADSADGLAVTPKQPLNFPEAIEIGFQVFARKTTFGPVFLSLQPRRQKFFAFRPGQRRNPVRPSAKQPGKRNRFQALTEAQFSPAIGVPFLPGR
jgi:hypothetical protein